jgi:hypothetical protein
LEQNHKLIYLDFSHNNIEIIENMEHLKKLKTFNISNNMKNDKYSNFEILNENEQLESIDIGYNNIKYIPDFSKLNKLKLYINGNKIIILENIENVIEIDLYLNFIEYSKYNTEMIEDHCRFHEIQKFFIDFSLSKLNTYYNNYHNNIESLNKNKIDYFAKKIKKNIKTLLSDKNENLKELKKQMNDKQQNDKKFIDPNEDINIIF